MVNKFKRGLKVLDRKLAIHELFDVKDGDEESSGRPDARTYEILLLILKRRLSDAETVMRLQNEIIYHSIPISPRVLLLGMETCEREGKMQMAQRWFDHALGGGLLLQSGSAKHPAPKFPRRTSHPQDEDFRNSAIFPKPNIPHTEMNYPLVGPNILISI